MREWWSQLANRERNGIMLAASVVLIFVLYQSWVNFSDHLSAMRQKIHSNQTLLAWMQSADAVLKKSPAHKAAAVKTPVAYLSYLKNKLSVAGLGDQVTQLKQAEQDAIEISFAKVEFDKWITFMLDVPTKEQVKIKQLSIVSQDETGVVSARVLLNLSDK